MNASKRITIEGTPHHTNEGMYLLRDYEMPTEDSDWTYIPFIQYDKDGSLRIGVALNSNDEADREMFVYLAPSSEGTPTDANVFVYAGIEGDAAVDPPESFVAVGRDWTDTP